MYRLIPLFLLTLLTACTPRTGEQQHEVSAIANHAPVETVNIIIGFADPEQNPEDPAFIESLKSDLNAGIFYLRGLSGNAALYACEARESGEQLITRLNKLGARADINYAEPDRKRTIKKPE